MHLFYLLARGRRYCKRPHSAPLTPILFPRRLAAMLPDALPSAQTRQFHAGIERRIPLTYTCRTEHPHAIQRNVARTTRSIVVDMVRTKDGDGIKSSLIISEVKKRPCLFDTNDPNYGDRAEKARCWEEVCDCVVPAWAALGPPEKFAAGMLSDVFINRPIRVCRRSVGARAAHATTESGRLLIVAFMLRALCSRLSKCT